jgi:ABC-2 type transport system permease protein
VTTSSTAAGQAGFRDVLLSEWTKLCTVRSTLWTVAALAVVTPAVAVFVGLTGSLQPDDTVLGGSLTGATVAQLVAAVLGVLVVAPEFGSGLIRTTLAASPRRWTVLGAKAALVATVVFVVALAGSTLAYVIGDALLAGDGYPQGDPLPALPGVAASVAVVGVLGLALGVILRSAAGAIGAAAGVMLVPPLLGPLFGDWQAWVVGGMPAAALQKLAQSSDAAAGAAGSLGGWPSLLLVGGYTAAMLAAAGWLLRTRDA